jgi:hypothetical protein
MLKMKYRRNEVRTKSFTILQKLGLKQQKEVEGKLKMRLKISQPKNERRL